MSHDSWINYQVPELAQFLIDGFEPAQQCVIGWQRVGETLSSTADALKLAAEQLVMVWPPITESASSAFMDEIASLIDDLRTTADAATANSVWIGCAVSSFETSRGEILALRNEWVENSYQQEMAFVSGALDWHHWANSRAHASLKRSDEAAFEAFTALRVPMDKVKDDATSMGSATSLMNDVLRWYQMQEGMGKGPNLTLSTDEDIAQEGTARLPLLKHEDKATGGQGSSGLPIQPTSPWLSGGSGGLVLGHTPQTVSMDSGDKTIIPDRGAPLVDRNGNNGRPARTVANATPNPTHSAEMVPPMPPIGGSLQPQRGRRRSRRQDEGETWPLASGAPRILLPSNTDVRHDPGPNVIGIDL